MKERNEGGRERRKGGRNRSRMDETERIIDG